MSSLQNRQHPVTNTGLRTAPQQLQSTAWSASATRGAWGPCCLHSESLPRWHLPCTDKHAQGSLSLKEKSTQISFGPTTSSAHRHASSPHFSRLPHTHAFVTPSRWGFTASSPTNSWKSLLSPATHPGFGSSLLRASPLPGLTSPLLLRTLCLGLALCFPIFSLVWLQDPGGEVRVTMSHPLDRHLPYPFSVFVDVKSLELFVYVCF